MWFVAASSAYAIPSLDFEFLDSGQIVGPTDTVVMRGRVTNVGTEALDGGNGQGTIFFSGDVFDQYFDPFNPPLSAPPGVTFLEPGESVDWIIVNFVPFPITGNLGDPVLLGDYVFPLANITTSFFVAAGVDSFTVVASQANAEDFRWQVVEEIPVQIPEPAPLTIFLGGLLFLAAQSLSRRRTSGY